MAVQSALALVGAAKQSVKGTAITTATFGHGLTDGAIMSVEVDQSIEEHTSGTRTSGDVNRTAITAGVDFTCRAHPRSIGLWAFGALGGIASTGAGPYTHTITSASDLPYLTTFGTLAGNYFRVQDVKVDSLGFSWSGNDPLEVAVSGMGTQLSILGANYTTTNDESTAAYFTPVGGTFSVDVDGASGTAATAKINSGEVTISNNADSVMVSGTIYPDDIIVGRQEVECSFEVTPDDLNLWRTIVTGTSGGSSVSSSVLYGTFSCQFVNGTNTLTLASTRVAFTCDFPDADPAGGTITLTLAGLAVSNAGATPLTATLVNSQASY
jgi:hypothetical protein